MKKWERDKWKHFYVGIGIGMILQSVAVYLFNMQLVFSYLLTFTALLVICYGFELFSLMTGKGHYEIMDAIAGILGGSLGIALICLFIFLQSA